MPRQSLELSIKRVAGLLDEAFTFETVTYEGFAPHRVPVVVECLTDNKNRTATNIRHHFRKGQMSPVAWDFTHVGLIEANAPSGADPEEAAIEVVLGSLGDYELQNLTQQAIALLPGPIVRRNPTLSNPFIRAKVYELAGGEALN